MTTDWITVISTVVATLLSPLIALQVSASLARRRQARDEKLRVFKTLMATRAATLDPRHVEALNQIDVAFYSAAIKDVAVRESWKEYLDHLNSGPVTDAWVDRRLVLLVELLHKMATNLGFNFDKTHIKNQCYSPRGWGDVETDQHAIRASLAAILQGKRPFPMSIANWPPGLGSTDQPGA